MLNDTYHDVEHVLQHVLFMNIYSGHIIFEVLRFKNDSTLEFIDDLVALTYNSRKSMHSICKMIDDRYELIRFIRVLDHWGVRQEFLDQTDAVIETKVLLSM